MNTEFIRDASQYRRFAIYRADLGDALKSAAVAVHAFGVQVKSCTVTYDLQVSAWVVEMFVPTFPVTSDCEPHYSVVEEPA
jgi:hypothetical protein